MRFLDNIWRIKMVREFIHYILVYLVLLFAWIPVMQFFQSEIVPTAMVVFIVFVVADLIIHKILKV